jgi:dienelactone hydrolase
MEDYFERGLMMMEPLTKKRRNESKRKVYRYLPKFMSKTPWQSKKIAMSVLVNKPSFSLNSSKVGFLRPTGQNGASEIWYLNTTTKSGAVPRVLATPVESGDTDANVSLEEALRRERTRMLAQGITSFSWLGDNSVLFPQKGSLYSLNIPTDDSSAVDAPRLTVDRKSMKEDAGCLDAQPSPDGRLVAFVQDRELYIADLSMSSPAVPVQITTGARDKESTTHGLADYIAEEEFDRHTGFWWSPCGRYIAFQKTEDSHIPPFRITHIGSENPAKEETHRYPFAGQKNAIVSLAVLDVQSVLTKVLIEKQVPPQPVWMNLGDNNDIYLARVVWASNGTSSVPSLGVQLLNRAQSVLDLHLFDVTTGKSTLLLRETSPQTAWINLHDCLYFIERPSPTDTSTGYFLWASERSGFQHLYLYSYSKLPSISSLPSARNAPTATLVRQVTGGPNWLVESIAHVGPSLAGPGVYIYFTGTLDGALERHLYTVPIVFNSPQETTSENSDDIVGARSENIYGISSCRRLTSGSGMHSVVVSRDGSLFCDSLSTLHSPPSLSIYRFFPGARFATAGELTRGLVSISVSPSLKSQSISISIGATSPSGNAVASVRQAAEQAATSAQRLFDDGTESSAVQISPHKNTLSSFLTAPSPSRSPGPAPYLELFSASSADPERLVIARGVQTFEKTGAYGPRISVGVSLIAVVHGSLPQSGGTPSHFVPMIQQVSKAAERASLGHLKQGSSISSQLHEELTQFGQTIAAPVQAAVGNLMTSVSSHVEGVAAQLKNADLGGRLESLGSRFASFGVQAGALLAGLPSPQESIATKASAEPSTPLNSSTPSTVVSTPAPIPIQDFSSPSPGIPASLPSSSNQVPLPPLIVSIPAADGTTPLFASLFLPDPDVFGPGPYPLVVSVYGGPHVMRVKHEFSTTNEVRAQALRREGILVACVDNRGSSRRGLAFESCIKHRMGSIEVDDQVALVNALVIAGLADETKIGCYGWSYGGYMALMLLAKAPSLFSVGVSGAPVTNWDGYDTAYSERYMGHPETNAEAYKESSVMTHARKISGKVMLVHGVVDENVHVRHTFRLINKLIEVNVPHELLLFPNERHAPRDVEGKAYMERRIKHFLLRTLSPTRA